MQQIIFTICMTLALSAHAFAGDYRASRFAASAHPYSNVPSAQFFYFVGQPVRIEALVEAEKRRDGEYRAFLEFKKFREELDASRGQQSASQIGEPHPAEKGESIAAVVRRCSACHGGAAPEGGLHLDGRRQLTSSQITAAQRRVLRNEMPPHERLSPDEMGQVLRELLSLETGQ